MTQKGTPLPLQWLQRALPSPKSLPLLVPLQKLPRLLNLLQFHGSVIYELALAMDTCLLPIYLYKIKSYTADLQHPLKGAQGGVQKRVTLCLELVGSGMAGQVFRADFMSPILVSPHI